MKWLFPKRSQWKNWALTSKVSYVSFWVGIISVIIGVASLYYSIATKTDRSMLEVSADEKTDEQVFLFRQIQDQIKTAMLNKKSDISSDAALIKEDSIKVEKNTAGNGTIITITAPPAKKFISKVELLTAWMIEVFSPDGTVPLTDEQVKTQFSDSDRTVTIEIMVNIPDLAERAKKVK